MNLYKVELYFLNLHDDCSYSSYVIAAKGIKEVVEIIEKEWVDAHIDKIILLATSIQDSSVVFLPK